jgi:hypothetical protein
LIDLARVAHRKSVTVSDLKRRAGEVHRAVGQNGEIYTLRFGDSEDMAVVPLDGLLELARERDDLLEMLGALERQLSTRSELPLLGGPDEDDLVRRRLAEPKLSGEEVLAAARARLGLD